MDKIYQIAQFGAFDVESFGDTLFPIALSAEIKLRLNCEITLFAKNSYFRKIDKIHVYPFEEFPEKYEQKAFDAIVIGGGEILHYRPIEFRNEDNVQVLEKGCLWKIPLKYGLAYHIPVWFNCVGVPYEFSADEQKELKELTKENVYLSVRDYYSYLRLINAGLEQNKVFCVADNLWNMNRLYPANKLIDIRNRILSSLNLEHPYIVVQYGTTYKADELLAQVNTLVKKYSLNTILLPINYCHEDRRVLHAMTQNAQKEIKMIDICLTPQEIMAVISGAILFIGTSLHGNITAISYGVKSVGIDMYPSFVSKMDGMFSMMRNYRYFVPETRGLLGTVADLLNDDEILDDLTHSVNECNEKLKKWFDFMAIKIKGEII